jgi:CrcB protein
MLVYIAVGGMVGTVSRYLLQGLVQGRGGSAVFPSGTLVVNLAGSFLLGFLIRYATGTTALSPELRAGVTIGFCGAFTTMSTFSYEAYTLLGDGEYWPAALYMGGTIVGSVAAVVAGTAIASRLL